MKYDDYEMDAIEDKLIAALDGADRRQALLALACVLHSVALCLSHGNEAAVATLYRSLADKTDGAIEKNAKLH